jgi:hypothetical protein
MSNSATVDRPVPHERAWSLEQRKQMMRAVVSDLAKAGVLPGVNAPAIASTYGVKTCEVEAEMMKHLSEGEGK